MFTRLTFSLKLSASSYKMTFTWHTWLYYPSSLSISLDITHSDFFFFFVSHTINWNRNIVRFIGVSFDTMPRMIILEFLEGKDVKEFLRKSRGTSNKPCPLNMGDLLVMALDVARGCEYLEAKHFIHRDIAARNCLLNRRHKLASSINAPPPDAGGFFNMSNYDDGFNHSGLITKIADFGKLILFLLTHKILASSLSPHAFYLYFDFLSLFLLLWSLLSSFDICNSIDDLLLLSSFTFASCVSWASYLFLSSTFTLQQWQVFLSLFSCICWRQRRKRQKMRLNLIIVCLTISQKNLLEYISV